MLMLTPGRKHLSRWALLALFFGGCLAAEPPSLLQDEHLYVDARLGFAMEHPRSWSKVKPDREGTTVRWQPPAGREAIPAEATVISLQGDLLPDAEDLLERYHSDRPEVVIDERAARDLPAGAALQVFAHSPERRYLIFFVTAAGRAFILEFSAPPKEFARQLPLFEEMAESFTPLAR